MRHPHVAPLAGLTVAAIALTWSLCLPSAQAGACARFGTLAARLVDPGGSIALAPGAGPILEIVPGEHVERSRMQQLADPFRRLRVRGPGSPSVTHRELAPGLHRVEGSFRAGTYRVSGVQEPGSVRFEAGTPRPLAAPVIASAGVTSQQVPGNPRRGGGSTTIRRLDVTMTDAAPEGAAWLLVYEGPADTSHPARHVARSALGARAFSFTEGGGSGRCGPSLPRGSVPVSGASLSAVWLATDGRLSAPSAVVTVGG